LDSAGSNIMPFSDGSDAVIALDGTTQIDSPSPRRV